MLPRTFLRSPLAQRPTALARLRLPAHPHGALSARFAAGQVSNQPGAKDLKHAATNIREEVGQSARARSPPSV